MRLALLRTDPVVAPYARPPEVPQFLLSLLPAPPPKGTGPSKTDPPKILVTQPRRIAALALSARVAAELGTPVGGRVGHAVRFDTNVSRQTRIVFATEGMVVRELLGDKLLRCASLACRTVAPPPPRG